MALHMAALSACPRCVVRGIEGRWRVAGCGAGVVVAVLLFKHGYAQADAAQLQWLLYPLAMLLNAVTSLHFAPLPNGEWWDATHHLVIVKACAGGNFLLVSWLGYVWQWRQRHWGVVVASAGAAAWGTALVANALRVLCIAYMEEGLIQASGLSATDGHRLIGIAVYFGMLVVQLAGALPVAVLIYLGITVLLPLLRAGVLGVDAVGWHHVVWTTGVPVGAWLGWLGWRWRHTATHKP